MMSGKQSIPETTAATDPRWWLYVIRCHDGSLYTGVTTDVKRRFAEHQQQGAKTARYLRGRSPLQLAFSVPVGERGQALRMEYRVKQLSRADKLAMIASQALPQALCKEVSQPTRVVQHESE
jgi:putative endonuclease